MLQSKGTHAHTHTHTYTHIYTHTRSYSANSSFASTRGVIVPNPDGISNSCHSFSHSGKSDVEDKVDKHNSFLKNKNRYLVNMIPYIHCKIHCGTSPDKTDHEINTMLTAFKSIFLMAWVQLIVFIFVGFATLYIASNHVHASPHQIVDWLRGTLWTLHPSILDLLQRKWQRPFFFLNPAASNADTHRFSHGRLWFDWKYDADPSVF